MPCTEFDRPDPLAGDRIMDATARLLAPRRLTLLPGILQGRTHGRRPKALCWTGRSAPPEERGPEEAALPTPPPRRRAGSRRRPSIKSPSQGRGQDRRRVLPGPAPSHRTSQGLHRAGQLDEALLPGYLTANTDEFGGYFMDYQAMYQQKLTTAEEAVKVVKIRRLGGLHLVHQPPHCPGQGSGRPAGMSSPT